MTAVFGLRSLRQRVLGGIGGLAVAALSMAGTGAHAMTLQDAIQYAVTTNPEIGQAGANREAIGFELRQARGLYLPQVDLEASIGPGWRDGPGDSEYDEDWMLRREVSIIGRQMLFDGYAADSEVERQASRADAAAYRVLERAEFVGLDIVQAYLDMLRQQDLLELARDNLAVQRGILGDVRQRVDAGRSSVADSQQANERVRSAQATLVDIERGLEDARLAFERLVGLPPFELSPPQPVAASVPADRAMAVTVALDDNPTLLAAEADIDTAYAEYRAAKANNYPTINLEGRARTGDDLDGVDGRETDVSALVVLRYNLYRGGIDQANIQEQIRRIDEARRRVLQVEREIEEQVGRSYVALDAASRRTEVLAEQIAFGEQVRTSYRQQFDIGQRTLLDVLDAENSLFNTRVAMVTAEYAERFAAYRVLASLGRLLPTLGVAPPETAVAEARAGADVPPTPVSEELPRRSLTR